MHRTSSRLLLAAAAAGLATNALAQVASPFTPPADIASTLPVGSIPGSEALRLTEAELELIAANSNLALHDLAQALRSDASAFVSPDMRLFYVCPLAPTPIEDESIARREFLAGSGIPLTEFLNLESLPGASKTIYLDFDGHNSVNNSWNHSINFPAWDRAGGTGTFTDSEREEIIFTWLEVAEDFAPFQINVTTKDPGIAALTKSNPNDQTYGMRVIMTQPTSGFGNGIGGVAFLGTFDDEIDNPCFVFNKGLGAGPMSASHEAGHTLALRHDGLNGSEYHPGSSGGSPSWGPIMGAPFNRQLVQWSNGDYPGASQGFQQDFSIITNTFNNVLYMPDDHPDVLFGGTPIQSGSVIDALITSFGDVDAFTFSAFGGDVTIDVRSTAAAPNLDVKFNLYTGSPPTLLDQFNPAGTIDAVKTYTNLLPGTYTVVVEGGFQPMTDGPVSNYGSAGNYTISLTQSILLLDIAFTSPPPATIAPDTPITLDIVVNENGDTLVGTPTLSYQRAADPTPTTIALTPIGGSLYTATLPAFDCADDPQFWLAAEGLLAGPVRNPVVGAYQTAIGEGATLADNAETDIGWTVTGNATDGQWTRGIPGNFGRSDPQEDFDGSGQAWLTDNAESNSDVDGGSTILISPTLDFSAGGSISFAYWMNDETNTIGPEDSFVAEISLDDGASWLPARSYTPATNWRTDTIDVTNEFGPSETLRIRFVATDNNPGDVLECGIDALLFESFGCTQEPEPCPPDTNNDGLLTPADFSAWVAAFNTNAPECDQNADGSCTPADFSAWVANFNAGC